LIDWILLVLLGGVVAIDATAYGQLMLSRPFVAATLAGALVGMPLEGAIVGAALEALSLSVLPVGAARYPDTGTAAVAAVGVLGLSNAAPVPPALLLVIVYGLAWQRIAGESVIAERYLNERLVRAGRPGKARMDAMIEHRHIATMLLDLLRGFVITFVALAAGVLLVRWAVPLWSFPAEYAALAVSVAAAAVLAGTAPLFADSRRARVFLLVGLACGSALLIVR
jgi:mannose/fructose/N-acetylgalactosamine-specific phosphotransferase system component IIC